MLILKIFVMILVIVIMRQCIYLVFMVSSPINLGRLFSKKKIFRGGDEPFSETSWRRVLIGRLMIRSSQGGRSFTNAFSSNLTK